MSKERLNEIHAMLRSDLHQENQYINSLKQTLVDRETRRMEIIDALESIERMLVEEDR